MSTYRAITCDADPLLIVHIDREQASATVFYDYDGRGERPTPFQTADMPAVDQKAAAKVNDWLEMQS